MFITKEMGSAGYVRFSDGAKFQDKNSVGYITLTKNTEIIVLGQQLTHSFLGEINANVICPPELLKSIKAVGTKSQEPVQQLQPTVVKKPRYQDIMDVDR